MAKKSKKRLKMPPLSLPDKLIYWALLLVLIASYISLLAIPLWLRHRIAYADEMVIASEGSVSVLWLALPWMTFFLMTMIPWMDAYQSRRPIFGLRNFRYGPPNSPKVYPLFMKNKPCVYVSPRRKKNRRLIAVILLMVLFLSFIPLPWSLYGRTSLHSSGQIVQYSMFNRQIREFTAGDMADIRVETFRYSTGKYYRTTHWGVRLVFTTDSGRQYSFDHRDFREDGHAEVAGWLSAMVRLLGRYNPAVIHVEGIENLEQVIADRALSQQEAQLLYRLFGQ